MRTLFKRVIVIGMGLATFGVVASPVFAAQFRREVVVQAETVKLGDLIDGLEQGGDVPVFAAPALGKSGQIRVERVQAVLRDLRLPPVAGEGVIAISRAGWEVSPLAMQEAVGRYLAGGQEALRFEVTLDAANGDKVFMPVSGGEIAVRALQRDARSGRFEAELAVVGGVQRWRVAGQAQALREVAVLARDVERNEALREGDLTFVMRPVQMVGVDPLGRTKDLGDLLPRRGLKAGEVLQKADLARPMLVEKNQIVHVSYSGNGLALSMRGRVQQSGARGETVQVMNMQSKRMIEGVVVGPGQVQVQPGMGAALPVASVELGKN